MNSKITLALMVVFVVLGTLAIFDPLRRQEKNDQKKQREEHVLWLDGKRLQSLRVSGKHPAMRLVCTMKEGCPFDGGGDWKLTDPVEDNADPSSAGTLASTLLNLRHSEKLEFTTPPNNNEFGFDKPQAEVAILAKGEAAPVTLSFGKAAAVGPNVYLKVSSEPLKVYLVPSYVPDMVNKEPFHWQSKRLFPKVESTAFTRIGWRDGKRELRAFKFNDRWRLDKPVAGLASQIMIDGLASTMAYATAKSVFSPWRGTIEAKELLRGKPALEVFFGVLDGSGHKVSLYPKPGASGKNGPRFYVAAVDNQPVLYNVDAPTFDRFQKETIEYRQRYLIEDHQRVQANEVRFTFPRERQETIFRLEGAEWKFQSGAQPTEAISQRRINAFLDALRDSPFESISSPPPKTFAAEPAELYIEAKGKSGLLLAAKFVVRQKNGAVLTEGEGELRTLGEGFLRLLPVRLTDLYEKNNKTVATLPAPEGEPHGNDSHAGHQH